MSLPLLGGYPMVLAVNPAAINARYQELARYNFLPTTWEAPGPHWHLSATVGPPFLSLDPAFPESIVLNFRVESGEFVASVIEDASTVTKERYPLAGVVFRLLTPTQLLRENAADNNLLLSLLLQLDAPQLTTVIETSQAIDTDMPDGVRVPLAARVQDYVRGLASAHRQAFIVAGSLVGGGAAGLTQPTQAHLSLTQGDSQGSLNWLYLLDFTPEPDSPVAGRFAQPLLDAGQAAVYVVHSYVLLRNLLLPAVAGALGIGPGNFHGWNDAAPNYPRVELKNEVAWRNGFVLKAVTLYVAGDHLQADCRAEQVTTDKNEVLGITLSSVTLTTTLTWSMAVGFANDGGVVKTTSSVFNQKAEQHSDSSILGIGFPSFLNGMMDDLVSALAPNLALGFGFSIGAGLQELSIPGGGTFRLEAVSLRDGNLRLQLRPGGLTRLTPAELNQSRSLQATEVVALTIHNHTNQRCDVRWLDYQGRSVAYPAVEASAVTTLTSYVTHVFSFFGEAGGGLSGYRLDAPGPVAIHLFAEARPRQVVLLPPVSGFNPINRR